MKTPIVTDPQIRRSSVLKLSLRLQDFFFRFLSLSLSFVLATEISIYIHIYKNRYILRAIEISQASFIKCSVHFSENPQCKHFLPINTGIMLFENIHSTFRRNHQHINAKIICASSVHRIAIFKQNN